MRLEASAGGPGARSPLRHRPEGASRRPEGLASSALGRRPPRCGRLAAAILACVVVSAGAGGREQPSSARERRHAPGTPATGSAPAHDAVALETLRGMEEAALALRDYTCVFVKQELQSRGLEPEQVFAMKWSRPHRVYVRKLNEPRAGQEALWAEGWNGGKLRAHRGAFPDLTVNLNPRGSLAMAGSHHPITDAGIRHLATLVGANVRLGLERGEGAVGVEGEERFDGRTCLRLRLTSPPDAVERLVAPHETVWDLARSAGQDAWVILHANRGLGWDSPSDPRAGERARIPRYYAGRLDLWVDLQTRLPLKLVAHDHEGVLYERYEHRSLDVNVGLTDLDFDPDNPAYDF